MNSINDDSPQFARLGASILDQAIENSSDFSGDTLSKKNKMSDKIYLHAVKLSNVLKTFKIHDPKYSNLKQEEISQIVPLVDIILSDLNENGKPLTPDIGLGSSIYEALRVMSFALLTITHSNQFNKYQSSPSFSEINFKNNIFNTSDQADNIGSIQYENIQLKNKLSAMEEQYETMKQVQNELIKENTELSTERSSFQRQIDDLQRKIDNLNDNEKSKQEMLDIVRLERQVQSQLDSEQIEHLREQAIQDSRTIKTLQKKLAYSPDEAENLYISTLLHTQAKGTEELMAYLKSEFHLSEHLSPSTIIPELQRTIKYLRSSSDNHKINDHPPETFENDRPNNLPKSSNPPIKELSCETTQIYVLESEIRALKVKVNELTELANKRKEKVQALNNTIQTLQDTIKTRNSKIEQLKNQNDKLILEHDELLYQSNHQHQKDDSKDDSIHLNSELRLLESENKKLTAALSETTNEMEKMTVELQRESSSKNSMFQLLQKQTQALTEYDTILQRNQNELNQKNAEIKLSKDNNEKLKKQIQSKSNCTHQEVIDNVRQYINSLDDFDHAEEIRQLISNSEDDSTTLIISLISFLINLLTKRSKSIVQQNEQSLSNLKEQNERLFIYISNLAVLIDQLATSGEFQKCIIDAQYEIDYKPQLIAQYTRILNFIKNNCNNEDEIDQIHKNFVDFPTFVNTYVNDTSDREQMLLLQLCITANDILRKFADKMQQQNEALHTDLNQIRHELIQTNNDTQDKISTATKSAIKQYKAEKARRIKAEDTLNKITNKLRVTKSPNAVVQQVLDMIDADSEIDSDVWTEDVRAVHNIQREIQKVTKEKEQAYKANQLLAQNAKDKVKKLKSIISQQILRIQELESVQEIVNNLTQQNESLNQVISKQKEAYKKQEKELKDMDQKLRDSEALKDSTFSRYKEESELQISSLQDELEDWKRKSECNDVEIQEEIRKVKKEAKLKLRKMQTDLIAQVQRADDTRNHYEPLLAETKEKLNQALQNEHQLQEEAQQFEIEKKQLKSELAAARIDLKMAQLKLNAMEEKLARDRNLIESQYQMKLVELKSKNQFILDDQKNQHETEFHNFLVDICEKFKDFVDFTEMITKETVETALNKVSTSMQEQTEKVQDLTEKTKELTKIKSLLCLKENDSLLPAFSNISKDASEYNQRKSEIANKQIELDNLIKSRKIENDQEVSNEDWEKWARRVFTLVNDFNSSAQTSKELQFSLEEILLGNISQRIITRRLDILREEKRILSTGLVVDVLRENENKKTRSGSQTLSKFRSIKPIDRSKLFTMKQLLIVLKCIQRLQKISGHAKCIITRNLCIENASNHSNDKDYPILNAED